MFSKDITGSDAFREMPASSQALYFHLGMDADDDGFLDSYKGLMRSINASDDDLKILITKRFLILFPSKIIVVKHWKINNTIQKDRYHETKHLDEKRGLLVKENGAYTECIQDVSKMEPQYRIGEDRIVGVATAPQEYSIVQGNTEENPERVQKTKPKYPHAKEVFSWFPHPEPNWIRNTTELIHAEMLWDRGEDKVKGALRFAAKHKNEEFCPKIITPTDLERKWAKLAEYKP